MEPIDFFYSDGTITVTNGSDIATGTFTSWDPGVLPYDIVFVNDGQNGANVVAAVVSATQIRLAKPWTGPTLANVPYFILRWIKHTDPRIYGVRVSDYLTRLRALPEDFEAVGQQVAADAAAAAASQTAAATSAQNAANWAEGTGEIQPGKFSAKTHADTAGQRAQTATSAANTATTNLTAFKNLWYGSSATFPATRPDGSARVAGDTFFKTGTDAGLKVWNGSAWDAAVLNINTNGAAMLTGATFTGNVEAPVLIAPVLTSKAPASGQTVTRRVWRGSAAADERWVEILQANNDLTIASRNDDGSVRASGLNIGRDGGLTTAGRKVFDSGDPIVRGDAVQALTEAQKAQVRANISVASRQVARVVVTSGSSSGIIVPIPADVGHLRLHGVFVASANDGRLLARISRDGGTTYDAAGAYTRGWLYRDGTTITGNNATPADWLPLTMVSSFSSMSMVFDAVLSPGSVGAAARLNVVTNGHSSAFGANNMIETVYAASAGRVTHLHIFPASPSQLAVGTSIVVEGY
ncbi:hypothetical protein [Microvirga lenta]|uniref:hypothetical protein n=1 Tax=Microvirga lenta TaxID=2881337 RepID=UPI001CFC6BA8|nr:hypothetical protein [Microvirga lenta]MCB5173633.1 hypothetical protein [Microvirga lenta]